MLLRRLIDKRVPWLGCSTTLDLVMLTEVRDLCRFDPAVRIQHTSINRPDIALSIRPMQYAIKSYRDLEFLIDPVKKKVNELALKQTEDRARKALARNDIEAAC